ncbi:hypothetical protein FHS29_004992 [Saccharothrix tamanrassetensis]|uniref:Extracellular solute-binding protein n=1 Tax=Saccharothrix tamanrassetensis TaxID=1051531 RepID=A0A841CPV0_9PSEU|nr:hypothetical protein [Saccharothrix tamanrassetensis]MBB5958384.1 hypothetical protein [Saccharothrix tamanrassetensis]
MIEEPGFTVVGPSKSIFRRKRFLLPFGISVATALAGVIALFASGTVALPFQGITVVRGMLASKRDFFQDPEVRRILMAHRIQVHVTPVGSRDIVHRDDLDTFDFVFPSGQSMAELVYRRREGKPTNPYKPFFTPIVLATYRDYAEALEDAKVVTAQAGGDGLYYDLSVPALIGVIRGGKFWSQFKRKDQSLLKNNNRIIAQTPDPCRTYSGSTYLGLVAFAENGNQVPAGEEAALRLARDIKPLFAIEGQHGEELAPKYLAPEGRTFAPVVVIYEHQYLAHQFAEQDRTGRPDRERVLLYPDAQHETVPELLAFTPAGSRVGELVSRNPDLRRRALELGFRVFGSGGSFDDSELAAHLRRRGLPTPASGLGDTEAWLPPRELFDKMIVEVGGCE